MFGAILYISIQKFGVGNNSKCFWKNQGSIYLIKNTS